MGNFQSGRHLIWAAHLIHRGNAIHSSLDTRRALRRSRRSRKTRYRKPRFDNRKRKAHFLPPSLQSRVDNIYNLVSRLSKLVPLSSGKSFQGFKTGNLLKAIVPRGKKTGTYVGRVKIRQSGNFCIDTCFGKVDGISHKYCKNLQHSDGYLYSAKDLTKGAAFPPIPKGTGFHAVM
jgi:hypothetical protein